MPEQITATEASRNFSDLLSRIRYRGESFDIVRGGEVVARIQPAAKRPRTTGAEMAAILREYHDLDPGFADDLERIQAEQPRLPDDPWDT